MPCHAMPCHAMPCRMAMGADGFPRMDGRARDESSVFRSLYPAWQGARPRCESRRQLRSQFSVTGLARALAAVPTATTVPVTVLCNESGKSRPVAVLCSGPDQGLGRGVTRDESSVFRPLEKPGKGLRHISPRCQPRLQFRLQFSVTGLARGLATMRCSVSGLCNGLGKGFRHGASRDCSSGFRHLERDWQWASQWCEARLQFRLQAYAARLAKGLATVRHGAIRDCIFRLHALCFGFGKGLRYGANRDCSSGRRHLARAWRRAWPRCLARLQFRLQASVTGLARGAATARLATTVPVSGLWKRAWQGASPRCQP